MKYTPRLLAAALLAAAVVLVLSWRLHSWGGPVLLVVAVAGYAWYRAQVARSAAAERFFGDQGEDTRLTSFQGGSPSEMPVDRAPPARSSRDPGH